MKENIKLLIYGGEVSLTTEFGGVKVIENDESGETAWT
jgi:hypothetical protein